jgi:hypothetical protein
VDRHERPGALADHRLRSGRRHAPGVGIDVAEDRGRPEGHHSLRGREECEGRHHDLVAGADAQRAEADHEGVGAVGESDAVLGPDVAGELRLEALDLGSQDVAATLQHGPLALGDLGQQRLERRPACEQWQGQGCSFA